MIYILCDFLRGKARTADEARTAEVAWVREADLKDYASESVQAYMNIRARYRRHTDFVAHNL